MRVSERGVSPTPGTALGAPGIGAQPLYTLSFGSYMPSAGVFYPLYYYYIYFIRKCPEQPEHPPRLNAVRRKLLWTAVLTPATPVQNGYLKKVFVTPIYPQSILLWGAWAWQVLHWALRAPAAPKTGPPKPPSHGLIQGTEIRPANHTSC